MNKMFKALAVVLCLSAAACTAVHDIAKENYKKECENIAGLLESCHIYFLRKGAFPESFEFIPNHTGDIKHSILSLNDVWGTKLRYERQRDKVKIISAGQDRVFETCDDLIGTVGVQTNANFIINYNYDCKKIGGCIMWSVD